MYMPPLIGTNESKFEISGHLRVVCPAYLPRNVQSSFDQALAQYKSSLGRKVNETFVYTSTIARHKESTRRNDRRKISLNHSGSPEINHVERIRGTYDRKAFDEHRIQERLVNSPKFSQAAAEPMLMRPVSDLISYSSTSNQRT